MVADSLCHTMSTISFSFSIWFESMYEQKKNEHDEKREMQTNKQASKQTICLWSVWFVRFQMEWNELSLERMRVVQILDERRRNCKWRALEFLPDDSWAVKNIWRRFVCFAIYSLCVCMCVYSGRSSYQWSHLLNYLNFLAPVLETVLLYAACCSQWIQINMVMFGCCWLFLLLFLSHPLSLLSIHSCTFSVSLWIHHWIESTHSISVSLFFDVAWFFFFFVFKLSLFFPGLLYSYFPVHWKYSWLGWVAKIGTNFSMHAQMHPNIQYIYATSHRRQHPQ